MIVSHEGWLLLLVEIVDVAPWTRIYMYKKKFTDFEWVYDENFILET